MNYLNKTRGLSREFRKQLSTLKIIVNKSTFVFLILTCCPLLLLAQWTQIGDDIDGESANEQSGYATCLSADGNTIIIGAPFNADNGSASGQVRVYENVANTWLQKGTAINGIAISDKFGFSVNISGDGNIIAVGAPDSNANGFESGEVRVFQFQGANWVLLGASIIGDAWGDHSGYAISLSKDGNRLAIGAPDNHVVEGEGSNHGQVRIYENQNDNWVQLGNDIIGENPEDNSGFAVSLNEDGSIVSIGAPNNTNTIQGAGHVRVYNYDANNWVQIGEDIDGTTLNDKFGGAVSLNNQGNILAVGAHDHNGIGQVRIFENITNTWVQIGNDIDGEAVGDEFGISVSLNANGNILAVGARYNSELASDAGHTKIYRNASGNWQQIGENIDGEAIQDRSGVSVSLNANGSIVAIGAYLNDDNGNNSGHVRLFSNTNILNIDTVSTKSQLIAFPNPTSTQLNIKLEKTINQSIVQLFNVEGKLLYSKAYANTENIAINMASFSNGIYILKIHLNDSQKILKVIKQ